MESSEQNFSIDHFEEKLVTTIPVLERTNQEDESDFVMVENLDVEGASDVSKTDGVLPQEQYEANILANEAVSKEKIEILMGVKQTIEVELEPEEASQEKNDQDMNPEKSELNLFIGSKGASSDQTLNVNLESKNVTSSVEGDITGRPADKGYILNVVVGQKKKEEDMEYPSPVFKSEVVRPSDPIDIEVEKVTKLDNKYQASTTIFVKNPDEEQPIQREQVALSGSAIIQPQLDDDQLIQKEQVTLTGSAVVKSHPIEVERKFQVTNFDENKLLQANGKLISEVCFEDEYFDNDSYDLILSDCWLRKRNKKWEFKIPVNRDESLLYTSTQFHELEEEKDIAAALHDIIKSEAAASFETQGIIEEFKLKPFATFTTTRKSYKLPSDCTVVIDFTNFGYSVGEIEMMVKDNSDVGKAIDKIDAIAGQLGFQMLSITELAKCI